MSSACPFPTRTGLPVSGVRLWLSPEEASGKTGRLLWVAMITSAENRSWADDVPFGDTYVNAGLPAPSLIRPCKLATIESGHAQRIGHVNTDLLERVVAYLQRSIRPTI